MDNPALASQLNDLINSNNNPNAPKAHLNYLFFDDKFNLLPGNSGVIQVPTGLTGWTTLNPTLVTGSAGSTQSGQISTTQPGYVIIYIDNQSIGKDVWFDNLMVVAPDERDAFSSDSEELGPRKLDDPKNNRADYKDGAAHKVGKEEGNWNVFKNGNFTGSYSADDYDAESAPSWYERTFQFTPNPNPRQSSGTEQRLPSVGQKDNKKQN